MIKEIIFKYRNKLFPELSRIDTNMQELLWAQKYHDTIQDKPWLKSISLSPNGMACNYSFLYILARILDEFKPKSILEFGLGESSKFINCYMDNYINETLLHIIEDNEEWINNFKFKKNIMCKIIHKPLVNTQFREIQFVQVFENLHQYLEKYYDLYIIDGPIGKSNFSRFDICTIAEKFSIESEFVILFDDTSRSGELQTIKYLKLILDKLNLEYYMLRFIGSKQQTLIFSKKYKNCLSY